MVPYDDRLRIVRKLGGNFGEVAEKIGVEENAFRAWVFYDEPLVDEEACRKLLGLVPET